MCISPTLLVVNGERIQAPCGRCFECVRKRKREWLQRILSEMSVSDVCFFSLISYSDDHYPDPDIADKKSLQKLIKRLRVTLERNFSDGSGFAPKLKYFIVSEYGEERNRLHYHAIFFLRHVDETVLPRQLWKELLESTWGKGFCSAFYLEEKTAKYCVKYIQKQYNMMMYSRLGGDAYSMSQLGSHHSIDNLPSFPLSGKNFLAPRAWRLRQLESETLSYMKAANINAFGCEKLALQSLSSITDNDKILINQKHVSDNKDMFDKPEPIRQSNKDITPNDEF